MIVVERKTGAVEGIRIENILSCNQDVDGQVWLAHWTGEKIFRGVVNHTVQEIQHKMFVARHGKAPAKGVIV